MDSAQRNNVLQTLEDYLTFMEISTADVSMRRATHGHRFPLSAFKNVELPDLDGLSQEGDDRALYYGPGEHDPRKFGTPANAGMVVPTREPETGQFGVRHWRRKVTSPYDAIRIAEYLRGQTVFDWTNGIRVQIFPSADDRKRLQEGATHRNVRTA